ncbi:MepB family protein [Crocinitomicaceae bacterium]|nr:MepB family protein [Crocinitomicaceae bacterium]
MDVTLIKIKTLIYDKCKLKVENYILENESQEYKAMRYTINNYNIVSRNSKLTPKKNGQFVTFWKRKNNGPIEPFHEFEDKISYFIVNVKYENKSGVFFFPKSILVEKRIISTNNKEGKRAFRVYPNWDKPNSKQAIKSKKWQLNYFFEIKEGLDLRKIQEMFI